MIAYMIALWTCSLIFVAVGAFCAWLRTRRPAPAPEVVEAPLTSCGDCRASYQRGAWLALPEAEADPAGKYQRRVCTCGKTLGMMPEVIDADPFYMDADEYLEHFPHTEMPREPMPGWPALGSVERMALWVWGQPPRGTL